MKVESKSIKWTLTAVAAAAVLTVVSCKGMKEEGMDIGSTVLIYIAADNNLAPNARQNIEDIISSGAVPEYFDDGVHPNYRGNREIARIIYERLTADAEKG